MLHSQFKYRTLPVTPFKKKYSETRKTVKQEDDSIKLKLGLDDTGWVEAIGKNISASIYPCKIA